MRALLDTCVISEIGRASGDARVRDRVSAIPGRDLFLSVLTLGELAKGIALLEPGHRKTTLATWLLVLEQNYGERILPVDTEVARTWGELTAAARRRGRTIAGTDGLIAATALRHGLPVMTRNVSDFEDTGARIINPWEDS